MNEALMAYRNTPVSNFPYTPNQMLYSRQVRTKLPVHPNVLKPHALQDVHVLLQRRSDKTKQYYDRGSKPLTPLKQGNTIRFRRPGDKFYAPAQVTKTLDLPRSYIVTDNRGRDYRRNRRDLHLSNEPSVRIEQDSLDDCVPRDDVVNNHRDDVNNHRDDVVNNQGLVQDSCEDSELSQNTCNTTVEEPRRSMRTRFQPVWHKDYVT